MSLLNDALKRAKLEALEREAAHRADYGLPTVRASRPRRWVGVVGVLLGLVLLALVGVGIGWLAARGAEREQAVEVQSAAATSGEATGPAEPRGEAAPQDGESAPPPQSSAAREHEVGLEPDSTQPTDGSPDQGQPGPGRAGDNAVSESPAPDQRQAAEHAPPAGADAPSTSPRLTDGASYVRALEFDGGGLELQGIAFKDGSSVAIINGLMVAPEDMVSGFLVVAIEPERVQLQGRGVTIYLALHPEP